MEIGSNTKKRPFFFESDRLVSSTKVPSRVFLSILFYKTDGNPDGFPTQLISVTE